MLERLLYLALILLFAAHPALFNRETAFLYLTLILAVAFVAAIRHRTGLRIQNLPRLVLYGAAGYVLSGLIATFMQPSWQIAPVFFWPLSSCS